MACDGCTEFLSQGSGTVAGSSNFSYEKTVIAEDPDNIPLTLLSVRALSKDGATLTDQTPEWLEATASGASVDVGAGFIYRLTVTVEIDAVRVMSPASGDPDVWGEGTYRIELRAQVTDGSKPVIVCAFDVCISGEVSGFDAQLFMVAGLEFDNSGVDWGLYGLQVSDPLNTLVKIRDVVVPVSVPSLSQFVAVGERLYFFERFVYDDVSSTSPNSDVWLKSIKPDGTDLQLHKNFVNPGNTYEGLDIRGDKIVYARTGGGAVFHDDFPALDNEQTVIVTTAKWCAYLGNDGVMLGTTTGLLRYLLDGTLKYSTGSFDAFGMVFNELLSECFMMEFTAGVYTVPPTIGDSGSTVRMFAADMQGAPTGGIAYDPVDERVYFADEETLGTVQAIKWIDDGARHSVPDPATDLLRLGQTTNLGDLTAIEGVQNMYYYPGEDRE